MPLVCDSNSDFGRNRTAKRAVFAAVAIWTLKSTPLSNTLRVFVLSCANFKGFMLKIAKSLRTNNRRAAITAVTAELIAQIEINGQSGAEIAHPRADFGQ